MTRLHVVGLPYSETAGDFSWDGQTAMVGRWARMMHDRGHTVIVYAGEENDVPCLEHVPIVSRAEQERWFPNLPRIFADVEGGWDPTAQWWRHTNQRTAIEVENRTEPGDLLCLIGGRAQQQLAELVPNIRTVEYAVGYRGVFADHRCYASNAWRSYVQGSEGSDAGRFFDTVIPHPFDPDEFHLADAKDDYLLYLGRVRETKGTSVAHDVAKLTGRRLLIAGPGGLSGIPDAEYLGVVTAAERAELMARAHAVLVPSLYLEPFGNVAVEAMLSGTPAITTNWGAYPETIQPGCGARCDTLADFVAAVDAEYDPPAVIRARTVARYGLDAIAPQYEAWFGRLALLDGPDGWHTMPTEGI